MLPLHGSHLPSSPDELAKAIAQGLQSLGLTPHQLSATGPRIDQLDLLSIDLSRSDAPTGGLPLTAQSGTSMAVRTKELRIIARPVYVDGVPLDMDLHATDAEFSHDTATVGCSLLSLRGAGAGQIRIHATMQALEQMARRKVTSTAAKQGLEVKSTRLQITQPEPSDGKSLHFSLTIEAKMFVMVAALVIRGRMHLDDQLDLHLSELRCEGEGMTGSAANAMLRPRFDALEARPFSLKSLVPDSLAVRDVRIDNVDGLTASAIFGSRASR